MVAGGGEWQFILFYVSYLLILGVFFSLDGAQILLGNVNQTIPITQPTTPAPSGLDILTFITYVISNLVLIFSLAFINPFSAIGFLGWISIVGGIVTIYIILRLVRGGG